MCTGGGVECLSTLLSFPRRNFTRRTQWRNVLHTTKCQNHGRCDNEEQDGDENEILFKRIILHQQSVLHHHMMYDMGCTSRQDSLRAFVRDSCLLPVVSASIKEGNRGNSNHTDVVYSLYFSSSSGGGVICRANPPAKATDFVCCKSRVIVAPHWRGCNRQLSTNLFA